MCRAHEPAVRIWAVDAAPTLLGRGFRFLQLITGAHYVIEAYLEYFVRASGVLT